MRNFFNKKATNFDKVYEDYEKMIQEYKESTDKERYLFEVEYALSQFKNSSFLSKSIENYFALISIIINLLISVIVFAASSYIAVEGIKAIPFVKISTVVILINLMLLLIFGSVRFKLENNFNGVDGSISKTVFVLEKFLDECKQGKFDDFNRNT